MPGKANPSTQSAIDLLYFSQNFTTTKSNNLRKNRRLLARKLRSLNSLDMTTLKLFLR